MPADARADPPASNSYSRTPGNPMSHASASLAAPSMSLSSRIRMLVVILMVVLISEAIGSMTFAVGPGKIVLQPMLWAIFIGAVVAAWASACPPAPAWTPPCRRASAAICNTRCCPSWPSSA